MSRSTYPVPHPLAMIAAALAARRPAILQRWRDAAAADPELGTASVLSRAQFVDHIPEVLDAFERRLIAHHDPAARDDAARHALDGAIGHGVVRWQQGYHQRELMREWRHLHLILVDELEALTAADPSLDPAACAIARRELARLAADGVCESASQYARMQQLEAAGRLADLESAVSELGRVQSQRAELLREAAHDLRGSLGAVHHAALALKVAPTAHEEMLALLERGIASMQALLDDLVSLARLEAGHERRDIVRCDAAALLRELCAALQPLAAARSLTLHGTGPETLPVETDPPKLRRIAQNLLLNALKYTRRGAVVLQWEASDGAGRWLLSVQDTGPGLAARDGAPIAHALKDATEESLAVRERLDALDASPAPLLPSFSPPSGAEPPGEGIGLAIVKRLCDLLDAGIELHSEPGKGSTFRVALPQRY